MGCGISRRVAGSTTTEGTSFGADSAMMCAHSSGVKSARATATFGLTDRDFERDERSWRAVGRQRHGGDQIALAQRDGIMLGRLVEQGKRGSPVGRAASADRDEHRMGQRPAAVTRDTRFFE